MIVYGINKLLITSTKKGASLARWMKVLTTIKVFKKNFPIKKLLTKFSKEKREVRPVKIED